MTREVADCIRRGLEEALAYAEGPVDASRYSAYLLVIDRNPKAVQKALKAA